MTEFDLEFVEDRDKLEFRVSLENSFLFGIPNWMHSSIMAAKSRLFSEGHSDLTEFFLTISLPRLTLVVLMDATWVGYFFSDKTGECIISARNVHKLTKSYSDFSFSLFFEFVLYTGMVASTMSTI